jgi:hypothetical protein
MDHVRARWKTRQQANTSSALGRAPPNGGMRAAWRVKRRGDITGVYSRRPGLGKPGRSKASDRKLAGDAAIQGPARRPQRRSIRKTRRGGPRRALFAKTRRGRSALRSTLDDRTQPPRAVVPRWGSRSGRTCVRHTEVRGGRRGTRRGSMERHARRQCPARHRSPSFGTAPGRRFRPSPIPVARVRAGREGHASHGSPPRAAVNTNKRQCPLA